jgi:hypothetical protein
VAFFQYLRRLLAVNEEFAKISPAQTRNPHNFERSPGGSSSGSAAAVADFMVPIALGMDLLALSQSVATLANTFHDEKFIRQEVQRMRDWLRLQAQSAAI